MRYSFTKHADRQFSKLPVVVQRRIIKKLKYYLATSQPLHYADSIGGEKGEDLPLPDRRLPVDV
jgi:hypothetical protein